MIPMNHRITLKAGEGGEILHQNGDVTYVEAEHGQNIICAPYAKNGYVVSDVRVDGVSVGNVLKYMFENVISDHTFEADFKAVKGATTNFNPSTGYVTEEFRRSDGITEAVFRRHVSPGFEKSEEISSSTQNAEISAVMKDDSVSVAIIHKRGGKDAIITDKQTMVLGKIMSAADEAWGKKKISASISNMSCEDMPSTMYLPSEFMKAIFELDACLTLALESGNIMLTPERTGKLAGMGKQITISISDAKKSLNAAQRDAAADNHVLAVSVISGKNAVSDLGPIDVSFRFILSEGCAPKVGLMDDKGVIADAGGNYRKGFGYIDFSMNTSKLAVLPKCAVAEKKKPA